MDHGADPRPRRGLALLLAFAALHALAVLSAPVVPTNDGPAHAWNAALLAHWTDPDWAALRSWFELDLRPVPNWTGHLLLAALQTLLSPELADRVLLAAYSFALPAAAGWALEQLRRGSGAFALLLLPAVHGVAFHMGFLNFCLGTVLWWVLLGLWWRTRGGPSGRRAAQLGGLGMALYFTHGLVWAAAWGALGTLAVWHALVERRDRRELLWLALAALPSAALAALFAGSSEGMVWLLDAGTRAQHLLALETLVSVHPAERLLAPAVALSIAGALVLGLFATRSRPLRGTDGALALTLAVLLAYFVAPDGIAGATFIHVRAMTFLLFAAVAAVAARPPEGPARALVLGAAAALSLALLGPRAARWQQVGEQVAERVAVLDRLPDGDVALHLMAGPVAHPWTEEQLPWRTRPLAHVVGWSAAKRPLRALPNYEAGTGHFPLRWAPGRDPRPELDGWLLAPPPLDLPGWEARGEAIDWILVSGPEVGLSPPIARFLAQRFEVAERAEGWTLHRRAP